MMGSRIEWHGPSNEPFPAEYEPGDEVWINDHKMTEEEIALALAGINDGGD